MVNITFDMREFNKAAKELGGNLDQVPFALARSMNDAAEKTRKKLITETWPGSGMNIRNKSFMGASLTTAGQRATKKKLSVTIYDKLNHGNLLEHADGGTHTPHRGSALALPSSAISARRTGKGVPKALRPGVLPNSFRKGDVIYQRTGSYAKALTPAAGQKRGKGQDNRKLTLMYVLKRSTTIKKDVSFRDVFEESMAVEVGRAFTTRFEQAMTTRR